MPGAKHPAGNNPANDPDLKPVKGRSQFRPNRSFYQSLLFGLNSPHFAMEAVEGDKVSVRVASDVDTLSLKAPVMTPVNMYKDYFFVPTRAILPHNADLLITNPLSGDDIDPDEVNTVIKRSYLYAYINRCVLFVNGYLTKAGSASSLKDANQYLIAALVASIQLLEPFASDGALLSHLACSVGQFVKTGTLSNQHNLFFDNFIEALCDRLVSTLDHFEVTISTLSDATTASFNNQTISVYTNLASSDSVGINWSFRDFLENLRQGSFVYNITNVVVKTSADSTLRALTYLQDPADLSSGANYTLYTNINSSDPLYLNYSRAVAYQLACATFYSDDAVDYVYSADLWHQNQMSLFLLATGQYVNLSASTTYYKLNGTFHEYDSVSGNLFNRVASPNYLTAQNISSGTLYVVSSSDRSKLYGMMGYFINIFGFTRSLKFRDYFCGSRKSPLAVGNTTVVVSGGSFDVVDVTKNIQIQRFLNQVNRIGRKFNEYVQGIFGVTPAHDPRTPIFLGSTTDTIGASETENTGADQLTQAQTITSRFRKNSSQFAFEGTFSEPGILIGIVRFDAVRPYADATDRTFFHVDRFDMFNPYLQQIGDQEVYGQEIVHDKTSSFGFKLRYSEYKQAVDYCAGAFREFLPGFCFLNDEHNFTNPIDGSVEISPDFIRSRPVEFDKFFVSLTHYSGAGYHHFIIRHDIDVNASRMMEAAPSIL